MQMHNCLSLGYKFSVFYQRWYQPYLDLPKLNHPGLLKQCYLCRVFEEPFLIQSCHLLQYRKNLERHESGCRISGITDGRFLTASHIKPWAKSNDSEKLDGNNGLLLSPHIDRLFDRGYISFEDSGRLMISHLVPSEVINAWGLTKPSHQKPLSSKQAVYMDFHRHKIYPGKI